MGKKKTKKPNKIIIMLTWKGTLRKKKETYLKKHKKEK